MLAPKARLTAHIESLIKREAMYISRDEKRIKGALPYRVSFVQRRIDRRTTKVAEYESWLKWLETETK